MRKSLVVAFALLVGLSSCQKNDEPVGKKMQVQGKEFTAVLGLNSGITTVDNGEMKAGGEGAEEGTFGENDLIGIQIKKLNITEEGEKEEGELVAAGLFTGADLNASNNGLAGSPDLSTATGVLKVKLEHGVEYVIEATAVKDGKNVIIKDVDEYSNPFGKEITSIGLWNDQPIGFVDLAMSHYSVDGINRVFCYDRFYCKKTITADYEKPSISIDLRRVSFKVNFLIHNVGVNTIVKGKVSYQKEGEYPETLEINYPKQFTDPSLASVGKDNVGEVKLGEQGSEKTYYRAHYIADNIISMNDIENAYACVSTPAAEGNPAVEAKETTNKFKVYFEVLSTTEADKVLRRFEKEISVTPNHVYTFMLDADTDKENGITVNCSDVWDTNVENVVVEEIKEDI